MVSILAIQRKGGTPITNLPKIEFESTPDLPKIAIRFFLEVAQERLMGTLLRRGIFGSAALGFYSARCNSRECSK